MRKLLVFTIAVFYMVTSCAEKDTCHSESTVPDETQSALIAVLQDFNQGLIDVSPETRGFWNSGSGRRNKIINPMF